MEKEDNRFKVADRRKFTEEGQLRDTTKDSPGKTDTPCDDTNNQEKPVESTPSPIIGQDTQESKMDFRTLVLSLTTTAMLQMGLIPNPSSQKIEKDLPAARQTIDVLEVLKDKTQGNLNPDELRLLDRCLHDLKMGFVEGSRKITL